MFIGLYLQPVVLLDTNGESCDGDSSEPDTETEQPVEASNNFVFVGAEIRTGKSSLRSKQPAKKKVTILYVDPSRGQSDPSIWNPN